MRGSCVPSDLPGFLDTHEVAKKTSFVVPGLAGCWHDGGVLWLTEIRGRDLRRRIRKGRMRDPMTLLDGLASLWQAPQEGFGARPFSLERAYSRALRSFRHNLRDRRDSLHRLNRNL